MNRLDHLRISSMKGLLAGAAMLVLTSFVQGASHQASLIFNFDNADASSLPDVSGQGHDGQLKHLSEKDLVPGLSGQALQFNGISSHVVIPNAGKLAFDEQSFTLALWIRPTQASGTLLSLLSDKSSSSGRYQLQLEKGIVHVRYRAGASSYAGIKADEPLALNQWHYLAVVFDAQDRKVSLYINGQLQKTEDWAGRTWGKADQPMYLGAHAGSQVQPSYKGLMDDVAILATAMKPEEITAQWTSRQRAIQANSPWADKPLMGYVIPPITSIRWMGNTVPSAEHVSNTIPMIAARGEFESASFILYPFQDIEKLEITVSDLKGKSRGGTIPAANLKLRVVKRWYQSGNAWDGYPLQNLSHRVLVPELLLNDEKLIKVDHEKQDNYLRFDRENGPEYVSISYTEPGSFKKPVNIAHLGQIEFNYSQEPVNDADTLQPVEMSAGQAKQFWITLQVPASMPADHYTGQITLRAAGKELGVMNVQLRVLPYELPLPLTYYDLNRDYYIDVKNRVRYPIEIRLTGGSEERAWARIRSVYRNIFEHGGYEISNLYLYRDFKPEDEKIFAQSLTLFKELDIPVRRIFGGDAGPHQWWIPYKDDADRQAREALVRKTVETSLRIAKETLGLRPDQVWFYGTDEATGKKLTDQIPTWQYIQSTGARIFTTGWGENIQTTAFAQDLHAKAGKPDPAEAARWHALGNLVSTYAYPFSGPEDPHLWRRNVGFLPYKANYDGFLLYAYFSGGRGNIWNDFLPAQYRCLNMVYLTRDGIIDTLAWEGFREGVDDVRYATLMSQLAAEAMQSDAVEIRQAGKRARQWLALLDSETADLDTARLEMINHIETLRKLLGKGE